jgi:hypothetical protein
MMFLHSNNNQKSPKKKLFNEIIFIHVRTENIQIRFKISFQTVNFKQKLKQTFYFEHEVSNI